MSTTEDVLERKVIYPGKPFIKQGEEHVRAYIIQYGRISAYIMEHDQKIEVTQYGPGRIIGEICLMSDEPMTMNYEALEETTVITLTRQEFQKKISKLDKNVSTILEHVMNKLNYQYANDVTKAKASAEYDEEAFRFVQSMITKVPPDRKIKYEQALLPHVNRMMKELRALKEEEQ